MQLRKLVEAGAITVAEAEAMAEGTITPPRMGVWPTPTVSGNHNRKGVSQTSGDGLMTAVRQAEPKFPTPTVAASKGSSPGSLTRKDGRSRVNDRLDHRVMAEHGGSLNPTWVEWLMGWPLGWTDLNASAMDKFQLWLTSHGNASFACDTR